MEGRCSRYYVKVPYHVIGMLRLWRVSGVWTNLYSFGKAGSLSGRAGGRRPLRKLELLSQWREMGCPNVWRENRQGWMRSMEEKEVERRAKVAWPSS